MTDPGQLGLAHGHVIFALVEQQPGQAGVMRDLENDPGLRYLLLEQPGPGVQQFRDGVGMKHWQQLSLIHI